MLASFPCASPTQLRTGLLDVVDLHSAPLFPTYSCLAVADAGCCLSNLELSTWIFVVSPNVHSDDALWCVSATVVFPGTCLQMTTVVPQDCDRRCLLTLCTAPTGLPRKSPCRQKFPPHRCHRFRPRHHLKLVKCRVSAKPMPVSTREQTETACLHRADGPEGG